MTGNPDRARCQPVKVGFAARVEAMVRDAQTREHARRVAEPAPTVEELDLARTLAAIQFGDTPAHVARMKADNPDWDDTRGLVPMARALLASDWYSRVQANVAQRGHSSP